MTLGVIADVGVSVVDDVMDCVTVGLAVSGEDGVPVFV